MSALEGSPCSWIADNKSAFSLDALGRFLCLLLPRDLKTCSAAPDQKTLLPEPEIFLFTKAN